MSARIIDRGRGPEIEGTRITVYRIMDYVRDGDRVARVQGVRPPKRLECFRGAAELSQRKATKGVHVRTSGSEP